MSAGLTFVREIFPTISTDGELAEAPAVRVDGSYVTVDIKPSLTGIFECVGLTSARMAILERERLLRERFETLAKRDADALAQAEIEIACLKESFDEVFAEREQLRAALGDGAPGLLRQAAAELLRVVADRICSGA